MKTFEIEYHNETIRVAAEGNYKLSYPDGRWLILGKQLDDTGTVSIFNDNINYGAASVWTIQDKSEGPDWVNKEQAQVIGELVLRKEMSVENSARA